jgi:hypothetical protein
MDILSINKLALDLVARDFSDGHSPNNAGPIKFVETTISNHSRVAPGMPIEISSDDARQGDMAHNTLHVLAFGLSGAILANALIFAFFAVS